MAALTNQVAVITGASGGIGKAIAVSLAKQGLSLCLLGRNKERLQKTAEIVAVSSPNVSIYQIDFSSEYELLSLIDQLKQRLQSIDILVHAAGEIVLDEMSNSKIEKLDLQYKINLRAPYLLTQMLLPRIKTCRGQIVFINSSVVNNPRANVGQYAATKHALKAIADSLRSEVNHAGIRVLSIFAGRTASVMQETIHRLENKIYNSQDLLQPEDVASVVINALTLPQTAEVTDLYIRPMRKS